MPQNDSQKTVIDGHEYEVMMLSPKSARKILIEIVRLAGPTLGGMIATGGGKSSGKAALAAVMNSNIDFGVLISGLMDRLTEDLVANHQYLLSQVTMVDGKPLDKVFDLHFRGKIGALLEWHFFAMKVQFADFIRAWGSVSSLLPAPQAETPVEVAKE